jgi:ABC-2 type transport system ATP-binding protein
VRVLRPAAVRATDLRRGRALDGCSLAVPVGMRLLLVAEPDGPASTLVRVLAGLTRPSRGRVDIAGLADASPAGWGRRVAYLGPEPGIRPWMTPRESLGLAAELLGLEGEDAERRIRRALAWTRIDSESADRPVRRGGLPLLQRTGLAAALVGDPELLLLDEPLRAIDADERRRMLRLPGRRRTILLASRYPASEEGLVSHVALLRGGRTVLLAPVEALERAGLPLSHRGIAALAQARERGQSAQAAVHAAAAR